ncbi:hypothetical protein EZL74_12875 [Flavobacterium silvisoli]|uniref:Uncharacterized protein n=1 Tax=Flavobacterium silvisoli TaxID=2529433 RepID=A0A4Q9YNC9_9FLAO|nr:hypothetical protein [Flavobacterium silvisoli]TBX64776.1 hypothetical protein EZL74_12875 [Flavobacterium silvisoli]
MKESILYLKEKLTSLFEEHSYLEIRYEFKNIINSHIIEVKPIHCFNSDRQYILKQIEIEEAFENKFFGEEVVFITEGSLVKIGNPILSLGVTSINVDLSTFIQQKVIVSAPKVCFEQSCYIISSESNFEVVNEASPPAYSKISNNQSKDSIVSESFLF